MNRKKSFHHRYESVVTMEISQFNQVESIESFEEEKCISPLKPFNVDDYSLQSISSLCENDLKL